MTGKDIQARELCGDAVNGGLIRDMAYTIWHGCHYPKHDDGNFDWGNDSLPLVDVAVEKVRSTIDARDATIARLERELGEAREALKPFAACAEQMDRDLPWARNGKVTFVHPLDGVLPKLYGMTDEECPTWPVPDELVLVRAWRYHDPQPASEGMGVNMADFRRAARTLGASS